MLVKDVMNADVKTIGPNETVKKSAILMNEYDIGSLIVVDDEKMVGIITERDLLKKIVAKSKESSKVKVRNVMNRRVIMIDPETSLSDAADIMNEHKIKKLPVLHEDNLVGIVTATDIIAAQPKMVEDLSKLFALQKQKTHVAG